MDELRPQRYQAMKPLFAKPAEAADLLRISRAQVYVLIKRGDLPSTKIGAELRIPIAAIEAMAEKAIGEQANRITE
jgi:excisionase family DNA binding protein